MKDWDFGKVTCFSGLIYYSKLLHFGLSPSFPPPHPFSPLSTMLHHPSIEWRFGRRWESCARNHQTLVIAHLHHFLSTTQVPPLEPKKVERASQRRVVCSGFKSKSTGDGSYYMAFPSREREIDEWNGKGHSVQHPHPLMLLSLRVDVMPIQYSVTLLIKVFCFSSMLLWMFTY